MPKRLTRSESQARTRTELIKSATTLYLRDGYAATSNDQVAEAAGFSRGAVYSNFANKEELALAVLDVHQAQQFDAVADALDGGTLLERFANFEKWVKTAVGERQWALLKSEVALSARRSPAFREQLAARDSVAREVVTTRIRQLFDELGTTPPVEPETLAKAIMAFGKGVAIDGIVDADASTEWLFELLRSTVQPMLLMLAAGKPHSNGS